MSCMGPAWRATNACDRTRGRRRSRAYFCPHAARRPAAALLMFAWPCAKRRKLGHDHATMLCILRAMACSAHSAYVHGMLGPGRPLARAYGALRRMRCDANLACCQESNVCYCCTPAHTIPASAETCPTGLGRELDCTPSGPYICTNSWPTECHRHERAHDQA